MDKIPDLSNSSAQFHSHPWFARGYIAAQPLFETAIHRWRVTQGHIAYGSVLIIGAGTGLDIPTINVPPELIKLLEPDETFYRFLLTHYPEYACLRAPVEEIPLPDETVDTVLSSLVLCSVQNLAQALQEIYRVLVPGGQFLFLEHVAHEAPAMRRLQHRINPLWGKIGGGCQLDRPVISALREQGFDVSAVKQLHRGFLIPVIQGRAVKPRPLQNPQETPH